ncbi:hypothetical protein BDN67DRAFT_1016822 [Paxillus ammoniavirescens]|nr:hypothetical protein BDN67DRAFT_1016822 [Paxillus ammoniavirescens]
MHASTSSSLLAKIGLQSVTLVPWTCLSVDADTSFKHHTAIRVLSFTIMHDVQGVEMVKKKKPEKRCRQSEGEGTNRGFVDL